MSARPTVPRLTALVFAAIVSLAVAITPRAARADDPPKQEELPKRQATFTWDKQEKGPDLLLASFSFTDIVDGEVRRKLSSGLPTVIAMRAYLLREGEANPVALAVRTCKVTYDLWEELYVLKTSGPGGERNSAAYNVEGVFRQCLQAVKMTVADRSLVVAGKPHFLGVIVEVNPVSPQMIDQMRKWVTRPAGSTGIGPGDALFGSFVGLFVREIGKADRTLRFRTQSLTP
jgi:hypothetical protein